MTAPPHTLQERLREEVEEARVTKTYVIAAHFGSEAADALDAQSNLLAEAGEALEFYATLDNYNCPISGTAVEGTARVHPSPIDLDDGERARAVLAKLKGTPHDEQIGYHTHGMVGI